MADILSMLAEYARNYMSDEALKKKAFGTENPTAEQMQEVAAQMAEKNFPEEGMEAPKMESAKTPAKTVTPMQPIQPMTPEDLIRMREERAAARKPKAQDTVNKVMGR